jgi:hypothetical protein
MTAVDIRHASRHHIDKQRARCLATRHIVSDVRLPSTAPASDSNRAANPIAAKAAKNDGHQGAGSRVVR